MASLSGSFLIFASPNHRRPKTLSPPLTCLRPKSSRCGASAKLRALHGVSAARASAKVPSDADSTAERGKGGDRPEPLRVGIVCGGPSAERGISLNSARSVLDHVQGEDMHVSCYYIDRNFNAYAISSAQLYSNTPADFDFKLDSLAQGFHSLAQFVEHLAASVDIVFPVIHGRFGEDGALQGLLEKASVPFVGTSSKECEKAFDKHNASVMLRRHGFVTIPNFLIQEHDTDTSDLARWFVQNQLDTSSGKVVVKPARAGSSIGVIVAYGVDDSIRKSKDIIFKGIDDKVLVEVFLEGGYEFTAIVLDMGTDSECRPVTLLPTEVELQLCNGHDITQDAIFNYRRKYLPTQQVAYHTPPRFPVDVIECIRHGAAMLFQLLGLRDFARIDGWFLPSSPLLLSPEKDHAFGHTEFGTVIFTDINLISGMEQTSFLFQQASRVGFSHSNILRTIIQHAYIRYPSVKRSNCFLSALNRSMKPSVFTKAAHVSDGPQNVFVLFGGETSERQVSLMSGSNIWLNLQAYSDLDVTPCLLAPENGYLLSSEHQNEDCSKDSNTVWSLPYSLVLRHTTEEVFTACVDALEPVRAATTSRLTNQVKNELLNSLDGQDWFMGFDINDGLPVKFSLDDWIRYVKEVHGVVFIAVHGGIGEDGTLQSLLDEAGIPHTGPGVVASRTCMDKVSTSLLLCHLKDLGIHTIPKDVLPREKLLNIPVADIWHHLTLKLQSETLCVKPARDGCSTGVAKLRSADDLKVYMMAIENCLPQIPADTLSDVHGVIEMPSTPPNSLIFEPFIETNKVMTTSVNGDASNLTWEEHNEWVEVTVGVVGKLGAMYSLTPSITVKEAGSVLSLEEKFQGGTGINLTPPPEAIMSKESLQKCKERIEIVANTLGLEGFSRIDAFVNILNGEILVIEVNTVPGMTPSTVLIHQALAEEPPIYPREFFRAVLDLAMQRSKNFSAVNGKRGG